MLIQKGANINVMINFPIKVDKVCNTEQFWKYFPCHFRNKSTTDEEEEQITLFEGIVKNNWLGITYIVLGKLEKFGFSIAKAIGVSIKLGKYQFAKTLLSKTVSKKKLNEIIEMKQNLMNCLAFYSDRNVDKSLVEDIFEILDDSGVSVSTMDCHGCNPLHHAANQGNSTLLELVLKKDLHLHHVVDDQGRTPIQSYFWNYKNNSIIDVEENSLNCGKNDVLDFLFAGGSDGNKLFFSKPLNFLQNGYDAEYKGLDYYSSSVDLQKVSVKVNPLMIAIAHRDKRMIKYLLQKGVDVNVVDSRGRSSLVYALKTNDQNILDLIMKEENVSFDMVDNQGFSIIDHALVYDPSVDETFSFDNAETMSKLLKNTFDKSIIIKGLNRAKSMAANRCSKVLSSFLKEKHVISFCTPKSLSQESNLINKKYNHVDDASKIMELMESELSKQKAQEHVKATIPKGCTMKHGKIFQEHDVLMTKVDIGFSCWGMYNFYRMQIWKDDHKELYVLFTNWGRINKYMDGQYQNTPFGKPEDAIEEFNKIFKAKTGNDWKDRHCFEEKPKKYRLVDVEHHTKVIRPTFSIDLMTKVESSMPTKMQKFMKDISAVSMLKNSYKKEKLVSSDSLPFERITKESVGKAEKVLQEIKEAIDKKERIDAKNCKTEKSEKEKEEEKAKVLTQLCKLSNHYYSLVPTFGFEFEKVPPIDDQSVFKEEEEKLKYLSEFETSKSILLGAMFRKNVIHPLDYISNSLECKIIELSEDSIDGKLIQKYLYNSKGMNSKKIESVFKIERKEDSQKFLNQRKDSNRRLLWHGTNLCNMMSILKNGLVVDSLFANKTGRAYGDGVYFADVIDKSINYNHGSDYMLLCDVELGSVKVKLYKYCKDDIFDK